MRHIIGVFLGNQFKSIAKETERYIMKYGERRLSPYFQTIIVNQDENEYKYTSISPVVVDKNKIIDVEDEFCVEETTQLTISDKDFDKTSLANYIRQLRNNTVVIQQPGDDPILVLTVFIRVDDSWAIDELKKLTIAVKEVNLPIRIDIFGILPDVLPQTDTDVQKQMRIAKDNADRITKMMAENIMFLSHFVIIQDINSSAIAINFTPEVLNAVIGEYLLLAIEHYNTMFPPEVLDEIHPIHSLGLSVMQFDRYYFAQYLLSKTYLSLMEKEKIFSTPVDSNKTEVVSDNLIKPYYNILSNFISQRMSVGKTLDKHEIGQCLDELFAEIKETLLSFISQHDLSLPEKKVVLSHLLGEDDEETTSVAFEKSQLSIDDIIQEPLQFIIDENNKNIETLLDEDENGNTKVVGDIDGNQKVDTRFLEMKALKKRICNSTNYIRKQTEEYENLQLEEEQTTNSYKRLTKDGFEFEGVIRKLNTVEEQLLETTYEPHEVKLESLDLRENFSPIKNQGQQGSCGAFAITSVYEYILRKNKCEVQDLSEAYVYYNARKIAGKTDEDSGTNFFDAINGIGDKGICKEQLCPYNDEDYSTAPSPEAYVDGSTRTITQAMNVNVKIEDIKSALNDGYPIAISLRLFESFVDCEAGFIKLPVEDEIALEEHSFHAMVICGYSDKEKIFIVRNSWGQSFGDKGYCYIPYSYISNKELCRMACIITDVGSSLRVEGIVGNKVAVSFNTTNNTILRGIIRTLIDEETAILKNLTEEYTGLRRYYLYILKLLGNDNKRDDIEKRSYERIDKEISLQTNRRGELDEVRSSRKRALSESKKVCTISVGLLYLISALLLYFWWEFDLSLWAAPTLAALTTILIAPIWYQFRLRLKSINREYGEMLSNINEQISQLQKERNILGKELYLAGQMLDRGVKLRMDLISKYNAFRSYLGNLRGWYKEESEHLGKMSPPNILPVISLNTNAILDQYYSNNKTELLKGLEMSAFFDEDDKLDEESIFNFKVKIKNAVIKKLYESSDSFSMYDYIVGNVKYDFVEQTSVGLGQVLPKMYQWSEVFVFNSQVKNGTNVAVQIFLSVGSDDINNWMKTYQSYFSATPKHNRIESKKRLNLLQLKKIAVEDVCAFLI